MRSQDDHNYRDYTETISQQVREFYRANHRFQTVEFGNSQRDKYLNHSYAKMGIWEALELLNTVIGESDPDTEFSQIQHCLQTSEAIRAKGHPRWFILVGLIHDLGKILCLRDEPQWAVTGDTFPVGCPYSEKIVFSEFFEANPDLKNPDYQSECARGIRGERDGGEWGVGSVGARAHADFSGASLSGRACDEGCAWCLAALSD